MASSAAQGPRADALRAEPLVGRPAPELPWVDVLGLDGETAAERVEALRRRTSGTVVLIDFWATWCAPCIQSLPEGLALARRHAEDDLTVVFATYLDERNTREAVADFVERGYQRRSSEPFDGIVALLDDWQEYTRWVSGGIPRYAVLDQRGVVRYQGTGTTTTRDAIRVAEELLGGALPLDNTERMKLAHEAVEQGDLDEAARRYRQILAIDPSHEAAYLGLWEVSRGRELSTSSPALTRTQSLLPDGFRTYETPHFVVLSDAEAGWVRTQSDRLERAHDEFMRFAYWMELRPLPLEHKLVAVAFAHRADFRSFAAKDGANGPQVAGYYSPRADRLVFYHVESNENIAENRRALEERLAEIDAVRRAARRASITGRRGEARELTEGLDEQIAAHAESERRLNLLAEQQSVSVTVHEAIHQLMFHTGVQAPTVRQPPWLSEGLATVFETDRVSGRFGPGEEYGPRRRRFWMLLDEGRLLPLRELITQTSASPDLYDQSYALVTWMCRSRRAQLRVYLRRLNALPKSPRSQEEIVGLFESAFGDIDRLEARWLRHERKAN